MATLEFAKKYFKLNKFFKIFSCKNLKYNNCITWFYRLLYIKNKKNTSLIILSRTKIIAFAGCPRDTLYICFKYNAFPKTKKQK